MPSQAPPFVSGALPAIGHALEFSRDTPGLLARGFAEHGPVFGIKLANQNVAVVIGPENQKQFFLETDKKLSIQKPYRFLRAMFGEVLFLADHEEYLRQRPIVQEAFRREKMAQYITIMEEVVQTWLNGLGERGQIDLTAAITHLVQEVAGHCFLGRETHERLGRVFWDRYDDLGRALDVLLPPDLPLPKFRRRDKARAAMLEQLRPIIAERRRNPDAYDDFLQDLITKQYKDGQDVEEELILNMLLGLLFAGHETTAGQAAWTIIMLLQHPDYLALVREEIAREAPAGSALDGRRLGHLQQVNWAVREVERVRPSAPMVMRVVEEPIAFGGYVVPAGWLVQVSADVSHNLPGYFEHPERFDPLRYAPDRAEDKADRFALIGFGGGLHKCTGMNFANLEMAVITTLFFRQYDAELVGGEPTIIRGAGANKPGPAVIRYRRRQQPVGAGQTAETAVPAV